MSGLNGRQNAASGIEIYIFVAELWEYATGRRGSYSVSILCILRCCIDFPLRLRSFDMLRSANKGRLIVMMDRLKADGNEFHFDLTVSSIFGILIDIDIVWLIPIESSNMKKYSSGILKGSKYYVSLRKMSSYFIKVSQTICS